MKKLLALTFLTLGLLAVLGPKEPVAEAQVPYCGHCCGTDIYGNLVIQCTLVQYVPCGNPCWCQQVPGQGQACY